MNKAAKLIEATTSFEGKFIVGFGLKGKDLEVIFSGDTSTILKDYKKIGDSDKTMNKLRNAKKITVKDGLIKDFK